jgi:UDP-N-acetylmuramate dehydrogenase
MIDISKLEAIVGDKRIKKDEPLVGHSIQKVAVIADYYLEVSVVDELIKIVQLAKTIGLPIYILGGGARIESTHDIHGLVIKNACRRFDKASMKGKIKQNQMDVGEVMVYAESGVIMNQLVRFTIEEGLEGLEYQLGLPGTVGGAIATNAKYIPKYLQVNKSLQSVRVLHENGDLQTYNGELPYFVYTEEEWGETKDIILSAVFKMTPADKKELWVRAEKASAWRTREFEKKE